MLNVELTFPKLNQIYVRLISSGILASLGIMLGLTPEISVRSLDATSEVEVSFPNYAFGQQFSPTEIANYAKAGYQVELLRRDVYQELKKLMNETPPDIVCDQQGTIDSLEPKAQAIAQRYCTRSQQIVQQNNLSINRFNQLKSQYDQRGSFYQQVQGILRQLQN